MCSYVTVSGAGHSNSAFYYVQSLRFLGWLKRVFSISSNQVATKTPHRDSSHDPQLSKSLQHILIYATQPLIVKSLLSAGSLHGLLDVVSHERNEIELVHWV